MKPLFVLSFVSLLAVRCGSGENSDTVKDEISGTYIRSSTHEFGNEQDTLVVVLQNEGSNQYTITRKWTYARVLDGRSLPPEYKQTSTVATYDASINVLRESGSGETYSYDPAKIVLYAGTTAYQKQK